MYAGRAMIRRSQYLAGGVADSGAYGEAHDTAKLPWNLHGQLAGNCDAAIGAQVREPGEKQAQNEWRREKRQG